VTKWCREAAETYGGTPATGWEETGDNFITTFSLVPSGPDDRPPLQAHCSLITGPPAGSDADARVLVLALDLLLEFPFPPRQSQPRHRTRWGKNWESTTSLGSSA
jgi:hypothetical protein